MQNIIDIRSYNELNTALSLAQHTVYKKVSSTITGICGSRAYTDIIR